MAFTPLFTISVSTDPTAIVLQDTSTGSDVAITSRQILLAQSSGTLLVPAIPWALATNPITINPLTVDIALNVVVKWLNVGGTPLYSYQLIYGFTTYGEQFLYSIVQTLSTSPNITRDTKYFSNFLKVRALIDATNSAINVGSDIGGAQYCISQYEAIIQNQAYYF